MRNGQNKRMRGRNNNRRSHNPLTRVYESNGPDVKIRGTASHVAEKYLQLARDAQSSGDPVSAESYYQHAEHYFRMIAAAQEQFRQNQPFQNRPEGGGSGNDMRDENFDESGDDESIGGPSGDQPIYGTRDPQPYLPRDAQFTQSEQPHGNRPQYNGPQQGNPSHGHNDESIDRLPSFITGGNQPQGQQNYPQHNQSNGYDGQGDRGHGDRNQGDRYGFRRRRRHRGPRNDMQSHGSSHDGGDDTGPQN
jgi:hypothetical protein